MYKQIIAVIVLSIIVSLLQPFVGDALRGYLAFHDWVNSLLAYIVATGKIGLMIQDVLSFLVVPFVIAIIIALIYKLIKKSNTPYFMVIVWVCWLVLVAGITLR